MPNPNRLRVAILFGGQSAEHEVSLQSAKNVIEALDKKKFEPVLIGIDTKGTWHLTNSSGYLLNADNPSAIQLKDDSQNVALLPGPTGKDLVSTTSKEPLGAIDVVFPVLHGPMGEDGTVQGLLRLAHLPFVGSGVLGSAIGMDKDVAKRLLRDAGIPTAPFVTIPYSQKADIDISSLIGTLGLPCFVKPANMGSSVGVSKVKQESELLPAIEEAFQYDTKVLVEGAIVGMEVECAVLGNDNPIASLPGRIIPEDDFYSYKAKYIDENGAALEVPAALDEKLVHEVQEVAIKTFKALEAEGMARVDMFITPENRIVINEINTIPGFTTISMYPKLWEASGISYTELITKLIELALERHDRQQRLKTLFLS